MHDDCTIHVRMNDTQRKKDYDNEQGKEFVSLSFLRMHRIFGLLGLKKAYKCVPLFIPLMVRHSVTIFQHPASFRIFILIRFSSLCCRSVHHCPLQFVHTKDALPSGAVSSYSRLLEGRPGERSGLWLFLSPRRLRPARFESGTALGAGSTTSPKDWFHTHTLLSSPCELERREYRECLDK